MQQENQDLRTIVEKSAQSDASYCKRLYDGLVDKIYPYVRYRTNGENEATDLTQDILIDLFAALPNFIYQSDAQFYAFVFVITKRKLARHYNELNARVPQSSRISNEAMLSSAADDNVHTEISHDVGRALETLDDTAREIVVLRHWSRHTFGEIAELLAMQENAVRVRHHRALQTLATILSA